MTPKPTAQSVPTIMLDPPSFSVMSPATATIDPTLRSNSPAIIVSESQGDHPEKGEGLHQGIDVVAVDEVGTEDREDCQDPDEQAGPYQKRGAAETTHDTGIPRGHRFIPPIRAPRITAATTTLVLTAS